MTMKKVFIISYKNEIINICYDVLFLEKFFVYAELAQLSKQVLHIGRVTACSSQTGFVQLVQAFRVFLCLRLCSLHM